MSNTKTYYIDPNVFLPTAQAGTAQSPADRTAAFYTNILAIANQQSRAYETLDTTGATLASDVYESQLNVSGTMAFTLADGTYKGQRKLVRCIAAANTPAATLTVTTPETATGLACSSTFFFDTVGQGVEFVWTENSKWRADKVYRAGGVANNVVVGTTVLTGKTLWRNYFLSVTGTVASSGTSGIPNGSAVGERILVAVSTAATIPSGTIAVGAAITLAGASGAKTLGTASATSQYAELEWDGQFWGIVGNATLVLS